MATDLILYNANVVTMEPKNPVAELVAVTGDKIFLVAKNEELKSVRGAKTKLIDCQGRTLVPGFNDAHCHIFSFIRKLLSLDLSPLNISSITEIKRALLTKAQNTPQGRWITGTGYNEFYLAERRHPTRWDIDEVVPHHPVVLVHHSLHACVLNSLALSLAGITEDTREPAGKLFDRDPNSGKLSGILFEMLGYIRERVLPALSGEELEQGANLANEHYLSCGITSLQDLSSSNDLSRWQTLTQLKEQDRLKGRVYMFFGIEAKPQFKKAGFYTGSGDKNLRLGGLKIMLSEATGNLEPSHSELNEMLLNAHRAGYQVAMHAVSESMVEAAISALEYLKSYFPKEDKRHRIAHCSECPPRLRERLKKLKAVIDTQPPFIYYSGDRYLANIAASELKHLYRIASFLKSGLTVAGSSDSPVVPNNPLPGIYAAVTRKTESGQELPPEEGIKPKEALALYTKNAAYASFEEPIKGTIAPGKLADMIILSDDPLKPPPDRIKDIRVEMTIIGGRVVWEL